jgi:hypothetical protein
MAVYIYLFDIIVKFVNHIPLLFAEAPIPLGASFFMSGKSPLTGPGRKQAGRSAMGAARLNISS